METILIVDDNKNMQFILSNILKDEGYDVIVAENGHKALKEVQKNLPDLVLCDIKLPGMDGMKILEKLRHIDENLTVMMITAYGDVKSAVKAIKLGAYDYITKPFDNVELLHNIKKALKTNSLTKEVEILKRKLSEKEPDEFVMGDSPQIQRVIKQVELISPTDMSVIIQGKSGTGKEVIANLIHYKSKRKDKPFRAVDCGAIPDTLVESELFGYEKGAFTGADSLKKGEFELANGGTIFLDEITNLPHAAQAKLLRVLQERKIRRIGDSKTINIDVRIIAATNMKITESVRDGIFRDDLYHRINEFKIALPTLQERTEDIPILAMDLLKDANAELDKKIIGFTPDALKKMVAYNWPGNVRELRHVVKRSVLFAEGDHISADLLEFESVSSPTDIRKQSINEYLEKILKEGSTLAEITSRISNETERELIQKILVETKYNKSKAARILGIDRNTLYAKMKNLGIDF